jgi:hypothetical protein
MRVGTCRLRVETLEGRVALAAAVDVYLAVAACGRGPAAEAADRPAVAGCVTDLPTFGHGSRNGGEVVSSDQFFVGP